VSAALSSALQPSRPWPLGAEVRASGVHFAVFSQRASAVELCLFDAEGRGEIARHVLAGPDDGVFHGFLPAARAGLVYGYRAHGAWRPEDGRRFNPAKVLLDPYAREIVGRFDWQPEHYGHTAHDERTPDPRDNASSALKARVLDDPGIAPGARNRPLHRADALVLYELHVRGFSMTLPGLPEHLRGSYAALAHPAALAHFARLGVTTLCLMPVTQALDEYHLHQRGLSNFWGYNPIGYFCPEPRYATDRTAATARAEFRAVVDTLHAHGIEVVIDVVFNHTAEGGAHGPLLGFRGLDNPSWYVLSGDDRSRYENYSGCGNTLRIAHPRVTQFVLDALRWWVERMGVDGFRFDLATALGRTRQGFDPTAPFFVALRQDPVLSTVHWIAEPWDLGHGGYQLGRFPGRFMEWNDKFRDRVRGYWLGNGVSRGEFARRFSASSDAFHHDRRAPSASINYVTAHDGFTLADLVSYSRKHNEANGEDGRDGNGHEVSANFGVEGSTNDAAILHTRRCVRRALLTTLLLAQGTPMLRAGDEFASSQSGNNNAYCQDNPIGWLDWSQVEAEADTLALVARLIALRRAHPLLRCDVWFPHPDEAGRGPRLAWYRPDAAPMRHEDWHGHDGSAFACQFHAARDSSPHWAVLFNPHAESSTFQLAHGPWRLVLDSAAPARSTTRDCVTRITAAARSVALLAHDSLEISP
jgi:glycogen operon protein